MKQDADVLVFGGGLAGSAAAILLARAGRNVTLIEREAVPRHKVCGEFLSAEALDLLGELGIDPAALGAVPVGGVRLCSERRVVEARLPFRAMSLTRLCLDPALLRCAEASGVDVIRGSGVDSLTHGGDLWRAALSDGRRLAAPDAILATGKHDLRGFGRPPGPQSDLVAMKMYWRLAPAQAAALAGHVELLLHPGGYTGLQPVEGGNANLCCLVQRRMLAQLGNRWEALLAHIRSACPHARERLAGAEPLLSKPLAIASIPYGYVRSEAAGERLWAVGDQAAVIPSFTGDGMSIALLSGVRAARSLLRGETAQVFHRELRDDLRHQVGRATWLSRSLVREPSKRVLVGAVRCWPGLLRGTALLTRVPKAALAAGTRAPGAI